MIPIQIHSDRVTVILSDFIKHDGFLQRTGLLMRMLHQYRQQLVDRKLVLVLPDGEPMAFTGLDRLLEIMVRNHGLSSDRVICRMVDHYPRFKSAWCTVETFPTPFFAETAELLCADLCRLNDDAKLFGAAYGRFTHSRLLMAYFLSTHFADDSFVVFQPEQDFVDFEMAPGGELFRHAVDWAASRTQHKKLESQFNGCVSSKACLPIYHELFGQYRIEIVIETNTFAQGWFTEKTAKCLAAGKPFLLYGTSGQLQQLRTMGFRTFGDHIDESYDCENDPDIRFDKICAAVTAIHDHAQRTQLLSDLDAIAQWNRQNYNKLVEDYYRDFSH